MKFINARIILFALLTLMVQLGIAQSKWDKYLDKADAYYEIGDYGKCTKTLAKFQKKVTKKLGANHEYQTRYSLLMAKNSLAAGFLGDFHVYIKQTVDNSISQNGDNTPDHARVLLEAAEIYTVYGNFLIAEEYVNKAKETLESSNQMDDNLDAKIQLTTAKIYSGQGYYNKALSYMNEIQEHFEGRAVSKISYVDESGKLKTRKLDEEEVIERMSDYATLITLEATTIGKQGEVFDADAKFAKNEAWISRNLGSKHIKYIENVFEWGKMLEANGILDLKKSVKEASFERSLSLMKKDYTASHYLAFDIYESLMKNYLYRDETGDYKRISSEYNKIIKKYFKNTSIHYVTRSTIELNTKLDKQKTSKLQAKASSLLANSRSIPKYHHKKIEILEFLINVAIHEKDYKDAEAYFKELLENKEHLYGLNSPEYHLSKIRLANFYLDFTSKFREAGEIYDSSFEGIIEKEVDPKHVDYLDILNHMALYYERNDEYEKAAKRLNSALLTARAKYEKTDIAYGIELDKIASLEMKIGEYELAKEHITEAMSILEEHRKDDRDVIHYIKGLETQAKLEAVYGEFDVAEDLIYDARKLLRKAEHKESYNELASKEDLASVEVILGRYTETEDILLEVISNYEKLYGKESRNLIRPLVDYGRLKLIVGDYTEAEKIARNVNQMALKIFGENSTKTAETLTLLAEITTTLGDYDQAHDYISRALKIEEEVFGRDHIDVAQSLSMEGLILFYQGGFNDKAERLLRESLQIIETKLGNRNPLYAEELKNLAIVAIAQKKYDDAFNSLELSEKIWISSVGKRNNINAAEIYVLTGDLFYQQYNYAKAEENYEKAKKLYDRFFNDEHPDYVKVLSKLSKVYYMQGDVKKAESTINEATDNYNKFIKEYFPALSEREKTKFWNTIKPDFEFFNTIAIERMSEDKRMMEKVYNNALTTKALLLNSSIKIRQNIMSSGDAELISNYNNWLNTKEVLTQALSMSDEQLAENGIDPVQLVRDVELLEKELSEKSDAFKSGDQQVTWEDVRESLEPNEVAIEMVRFRYFDHVFTDSVIYAALYVKNDKDNPRPNVSLLTNGQDLEHRFFKSYRNSIIYKIPDRYSNEAYWQPIKSIAGNYATIYLSADGVFNQINLEAIPTEDGKYVLDNSNIVLVSNTKELFHNKVNKRTVSEDKRALMFGNPDFYLSASASNKIAQLPGTELEIAELKKVLRQQGWITQDYVEKGAQEDQVKEMDSPKVFHIATHGFFRGSDDLGAETNEIEVNKNKVFENPLLKTGLLLTGAGDILDETEINYNKESGILTAYEAMNLNLDQTELVVLSACETGLGDLQVGEGVYGLQRAFLVAGARTLIMSMFKVDDAATQKLMVTFYKRWLETGQMRQSFIEAKKEVRNQYQEPIYWAAFIMIGLE